MSEKSIIPKLIILAGILLTTVFTVSMYSVLVLVFLKASWGKGIGFSIASGVVFGAIFGFLFNQKRAKLNLLYQTIEQQEIIKEISLLPHQHLFLENLLNKTIRLIVSASFAKLQSRGAIFLIKDNNLFELKSHTNKPEFIHQKCGVEGFEIGECLCGLAAQQKKTIFRNCVDEDHTISYEGIVEHGHYNVPIIHKNEVLGVIVVYLEAGHKKNSIEINFLEAVANVLALIVKKYMADREAQNNELVFREVQKFAGIGTWKKNINTGEIVASEEVYIMMGYQPYEIQLSEKFFINTVHPSDAKKLQKAVKNAKNGTPYELELCHLKKDGSTVNVINKCKPKVLSDGTVSEVSGIILDVTKLIKSENGFIEKQQLVNGILNATPDPLFLLDLYSSKLIYCNNAMEEVLKKNSIFKKAYDKIGVKLFRELVHPDDRATHDLMNKAIRLGKDYYIAKFRTKVFDNSYRWIEQRVLVYKRSQDGYVNQVLVVSKDIHTKVLAENSNKKLNEELIHQNVEMKKINKELDQFVYSASHDLRAPISSILGLINLSKYESNLPNLKEHLTRIETSVYKLEKVIKDILDYSRNARVGLETKEICMRSILKDAVKSAETIIPLNIEVDYEVEETVAFWGDERRIKIILNNIISNANNYADQSKKKRFLKVSVKVLKNGCKLFFEDNGIGISKKNQDKIFNMFFRGSLLSQGAGLGLYIVKEVISKLKGTIDISSQEGIGTKIFIELPQASKIYTQNGLK